MPLGASARDTHDEPERPLASRAHAGQAGPDASHRAHPVRAAGVVADSARARRGRNERDLAGIASAIDDVAGFVGTKVGRGQHVRDRPARRTVPVLAVFVNAMSAAPGVMSLIVVVKAEVLFAVTGSIVEAETVAVLTIGTRCGTGADREGRGDACASRRKRALRGCREKASCRRPSSRRTSGRPAWDRLTITACASRRAGVRDGQRVRNRRRPGALRPRRSS